MMSNKCCRCWITCGAVLLGLGVIAGAVAAHGLDERLESVHGANPPVKKLTGDQRPEVLASAVEFILEGLHLNRRLNCERTEAGSIYRR